MHRRSTLRRKVGLARSAWKKTPKIKKIEFYPKARIKSVAKRKKESAGKLKKRLWELVKRVIRIKYALPDGTWRCYTCDKHITEPSDAHTAHFIASSVCGASLRFNLRNLRICCYKCNVQLGGNGIEYYPRMVKEMGQEEVDELKRIARTFLIKADIPWYLEQIAAMEAHLVTLMQQQSS
jgi:hypothetical protein